MGLLTAVLNTFPREFPPAVKVIPASRIKPQRAGMDVANASDY
jgi:hypothetical protein